MAKDKATDWKAVEAACANLVKVLGDEPEARIVAVRVKSIRHHRHLCEEREAAEAKAGK